MITRSSGKQAFANWDKTSSVRSRPHRLLNAGEGGHYFRPDLVPTSLHKIVAGYGPAVQEQVLVHHLLNYLRFTEYLEHKVVNQVAFALGTGEIELGLPPQLRLDALKLLVDESYHAMFSADLEHQVIAETGVSPVPGLLPVFLSKLEKIKARVERRFHPMVDLFFTTVSETLISGTLTKVPWDKTVVATVREVLKDHANDEAIHHAYFADVLRRTWPQLSEKERKVIGPLLPEFIFGFLEPDYVATLRSLEAVGLTKAEASAVVEDCYPRQPVLASIQAASTVTMTHFHEAGVFADDDIAEAFERKGLEPRRIISHLDRTLPKDLFQGLQVNERTQS